MALLTSEKRREVWATYMEAMSNDREPCGITKGDLRDALNAADQWVSDNASSFNQALPPKARNGLTAVQKARLLVYVVEKRFTEGV